MKYLPLVLALLFFLVSAPFFLWNPSALSSSNGLPATVAVNASQDRVTSPQEVVTFTVHVNNLTDSSLPVVSLQASDYGDLNGRGDCRIPLSIDAGETYTCSYSKAVGEGHEVTPDEYVIIVAAQIEVDSGETLTVQGEERVWLDTPGEEAPSVGLELSTERHVLPQPIATVELTVRVVNGLSIPLTLTELASIELVSWPQPERADLNGVGTCETGIALEAGATYTCTLEMRINTYDSSDVVVHATATTPGGDRFYAEDSVSFGQHRDPVKVTARSPQVRSGGTVEWEVFVSNTWTEEVTIADVTSTRVGSLMERCGLALTLSPGVGIRCSYPQRLATALDREDMVDVVIVTVQHPNGSTYKFVDAGAVTVVQNRVLLPLLLNGFGD